MNYKEFLDLINETYNTFGWRYGQTIMIVLYAVCSRTYVKVANTEHDCYEDDEKAPKTLQFIKKEWDKDASMQETAI